MKIIAGAFILLTTALGLPVVVGDIDPGATGDFVNVPEATSKDFCRLTYDQIANDQYRCDVIHDAAAGASGD